MWNASLFSMGGFGTWDIIQRMQETFAAAMPVCGGGDTSMAETLKDMPIRVFHGDNLAWLLAQKKPE